jgi:hypothetical protein
MERAARNYRDGRAVGFDRLSEHPTEELACIHELEHYESKVGGSDEVTSEVLRCTTVFRFEDGAWRIVHRHADPIAETRDAESVIRR